MNIGRASAVCGQSDASFSSNEDSFCLQMQVKSAQAKTKMQAPASSYKYRTQGETS